jgi:hypothetical protein
MSEKLFLLLITHHLSLITILFSYEVCFISNLGLLVGGYSVGAGG